jgi:hypothetical protein
MTLFREKTGQVSSFMRCNRPVTPNTVLLFLISPPVKLKTAYAASVLCQFAMANLPHATLITYTIWPLKTQVCTLPDTDIFSASIIASICRRFLIDGTGNQQVIGNYYPLRISWRATLNRFIEDHHLKSVPRFRSRLLQDFHRCGVKKDRDQRAFFFNSGIFPLPL